MAPGPQTRSPRMASAGARPQPNEALSAKYDEDVRRDRKLESFQNVAVDQDRVRRDFSPSIAFESKHVMKDAGSADGHERIQKEISLVSCTLYWKGQKP